MYFYLIPWVKHKIQMNIIVVEETFVCYWKSLAPLTEEMINSEFKK